jgi:nickel transport protein
LSKDLAVKVNLTGLTMLFGMVIFLLPARLYSHGVAGKVDTGGIVVRTEYSTGEPMSYAKVRITAPGEEITFQSGRTDRKGRFCFFPDVKGNWKVVVDDEMGHRLEMGVPVNDQLAWKEDQKSGGTGKTGFSRYEKALMGICIIFGLFGIFSWSKRKKGQAVS